MSEDNMELEEYIEDAVESEFGTEEQDTQDDIDFVVGDNAQSALISFVERIERLEEEKQALADDIKEVFAEVKGNGFDVKILRKVMKLRAMDQDERQEQEALIDLYETAIDGK